MSTRPMPVIDPYAAYGGSAIQSQSADPYASYGGQQNQHLSQADSNPRGEGTYPMWDNAGKLHQVPFSLVNTLAKQGFKFDTNPIKDPTNKDRNGLDPSQAYQRDLSYATTGPGHEEQYAQSDRNAPLPVQAISGVVKGIGTIGKPVMDVVGRMGGVPQSAIDASLQAQTPMETAGKGAMMASALAPSAVAAPVATAAGLAGGTVGAGAGHVVAQEMGASPEATALMEDVGGIAGGIGGAKLGPAAVSAASNTLMPKGQWTGAAQADIPWMKLASRVGPAGTGQSALGVKNSLAADLKANLAQVPGVLDAKNPLEFSKAAEHFLNETAIPEYHSIADPLAGEKIGATTFKSGSPVAKFIVPSTGSPLPSNPTIAETESALREVNSILSKAYQSPANAATASSVQNLESVADQMRSAINSKIGEISGLPPQTVSALRQRIGAISNIVDNSRERYLANMGGVTSPQVAAVGGGSARSMPARGIRSALLQPLENFQFRRDLSAAGNVAPQLDPNSPLGQFYALKSLGKVSQ